jgi:hypothetical protein
MMTTATTPATTPPIIPPILVPELSCDSVVVALELGVIDVLSGAGLEAMGGRFGGSSG